MSKIGFGVQSSLGYLYTDFKEKAIKIGWIFNDEFARGKFIPECNHPTAGFYFGSDFDAYKNDLAFAPSHLSNITIYNLDNNFNIVVDYIRDVYKKYYSISWNEKKYFIRNITCQTYFSYNLALNKAFDKLKITNNVNIDKNLSKEKFYLLNEFTKDFLYYWKTDKENLQEYVSRRVDIKDESKFNRITQKLIKILKT